MSFVLWDKVRLFMKRGNVYGHENLFQNQSDPDRVFSGRDVVDFTDPNFILEQTNVQINRLERYKDYDQMDEVGEISLALDMYSDEASLRDPERNHSVFVKTKSKRMKNAVEEFLYGTINVDAQIRPMARYLSKYGDLSIELVPTHNRDGLATFRIMPIYNFTRAETKYGDLIGFFHQEEGGQPDYYHPWQVVHMRLASFEKIFHPYGKSILDGARRDFRRLRLMEDAALVYRLCLRGDSKVWTPNGYKEIKDIKIGDEIYSYTAEGALKLTNVIDHKCNGRDKIYRVFSRHREIHANATHPILVEEKFRKNNEWHSVLRYVDVKDLKTLRNTRKEYCHRFVLPAFENNEYVTLNKPEVQKYIRINDKINKDDGLSYIGKISGLRKSSVKSFFDGRDVKLSNAIAVMDHVEHDGDYEVIDSWSYDNHKMTATEYIIPDIANEKFARWFGFMIGDGFVSERVYRKNNAAVHQVGFALGDKLEINEKYKDLFEDLVGSDVKFGGDTGHRLGSYYVCSKYFVEFMKMNGFIPGAHNKRVPNWVFKSPRSVQEAFIDGYVDADGHCRVIKNGINESIELDCCNKKLLDDIKELCHRLGWNVGMVRDHERKGGHVIDKQTGRMMPDTMAWSLYFTKESSGFSERILGVEECGEDLIYDISVDSDEHNFAVNGILTHNTRAPEKRLFKVPVGNLPPKEREQYLQIIARRFKKHKFIDPTTGALNERYAPHIQDDDYWVPVTGDGSGVEVQTLQGGENLDAIADIEYFKKKMVSALKIPFHRVGLGDSGGDAGKSIASQSPEFSKAVQWIQDQIIVGIKKMVLVHLTLEGYTVDDMKNFELGMTSASAIDELYRIETWASRVDIMGGIKDLGIFPDEWIVERFTDMTLDELELIKKMQKLSSKKESEESEESEAGFFESKKYDKLLLELSIKEMHDKREILQEDKLKYSNIISFQKMINESEFDGINNENYLDADKNKAKLIIENLLKDNYFDLECINEEEEEENNEEDDILIEENELL